MEREGKIETRVERREVERSGKRKWRERRERRGERGEVKRRRDKERRRWREGPEERGEGGASC